MNTVTLIGHAGRDSERRELSGGKVVTKFSMATTDKFGDKEHTVWHNIVCWNKTAEFAESVKKGDQVMVMGRINIQKYTAKDGTEKSGMEIIANQIVVSNSSKKAMIEPRDKPQGLGDPDLQGIPF